MLTRQKYATFHLPYEKNLLSYYKKDEALTIFEIGACECEDTVKIYDLFPNATIHATEPVTTNRINATKYLKSKDLYRKIYLSYYAFSDFNGIADMHLSSGHPETEAVTDWNFGNKSSSLLPPFKHLEKLKWCKFEKKESVPVCTLEHYVNMINGSHKEIGCPFIEQIDFIHMDCQGAELKILQGAGKWLKAIRLIYMEVGELELYKGQPLKDDIIKFMTESGFDLDNEDMDGDAGNHLWINRHFEKIQK